MTKSEIREKPERLIPKTVGFSCSSLVTRPSFLAARLSLLFLVMENGGEDFPTDAFGPEVVVIESEDYDFTDEIGRTGQFIDHPRLIPEGSSPVPDSYLNQEGTPDVDYFDMATAVENRYREFDAVGIGRAGDVDREKFLEVGGAEAGVFDYAIRDIRAGEWLNYTRTFPSNRYRVYLRQAQSSPERSTTFLEWLTFDPMTQSCHPLSLGVFIGAHSNGEYRNIPLTDPMGQELVLVELAGVETLRIVQNTDTPEPDTLLQNALILIPAPEPDKTRPTLVEVSPVDGSVVNATSVLIRAFVRNADTSVDVDSIVLKLNGAMVNHAILRDEVGVTIAYRPLDRPEANAPQTVDLSFADDDGVGQSHTWSYRLDYSVLPPEKALFLELGQDRGFDVRVVQAPTGFVFDTAPNTVERAEEQLSPSSSIRVESAASSQTLVINYGLDEGVSDGFFSDDAWIPGVGPDNGVDPSNTDNVAMEILTWLRLVRGTYRMGLAYDDGFRLECAEGADDSTGIEIVLSGSGGVTEFEMIVSQSGLYPFRLVWYQNDGAAHLEWYSFDPGTGERVPLNQSSMATAIEAYRSIGRFPEVYLESAIEPQGPYLPAISAVIDLGGRTVRIPVSGRQRFYRVLGRTAFEITKIQLQGSNIVIGYR